MDLEVAMQEVEKEEFKFYKGSEYLALPRDPQPWLIEKIVPSGGAMNLYGKPKLGKSYAALGIALAVSDDTQTHWLGFPVLKHGPVAYLQVDTPRSEWAGRTDKLKKNGFDIENIHFTDSNLVPYPLDLTQPVRKEALKEKIKAIKPVLLVIDTLREVHDGDENDSKAMKGIITSLVECTRESNCAILLVSHSRKDQAPKGGGKGEGDGGDIMNDGRGSSYVSGRMDVVAKLTEKNLLLKGRSIGQTKIPIEQDSNGMIQADAAKAESVQHLMFVIEQPGLESDRQRAEMLAGLEGIELETARSRIRAYRKKVKASRGDDGEENTTEAL